MYRCKECGHLFEDGEQAEWVEPHGEEWSGCPLCKGSYEEAKKCMLCGSYELEDGENVCEPCKDDLRSKVKKFLSQFNDDEKNIIYELLEEF